MDRGFGGRDRYDDRSRDYDRGEAVLPRGGGSGGTGESQQQGESWCLRVNPSNAEGIPIAEDKSRYLRVNPNG